MSALKEGDVAPDFTLPDGSGKTVRLKDLRGKPVVLYFYPRDMTPGCTREACDFRDSYSGLRRRGAVLLGVSRDPPESHARFASKYSLPFPLLSDAGGEVCRAYGVYKKKSLYGRTFMGIERSTFVIDASGRVQRVFRRVKVEGHAGEVLGVLG
ncbi:MAG: thioredoxin-dependent thiol peroxidase [Euryarchaeota archaeon]|nr:thioredoxin-dependent thiol peroxidase [Euryarchaeota archaeon]